MSVQHRATTSLRSRRGFFGILVVLLLALGAVGSLSVVSAQVGSPSPTASPVSTPPPSASPQPILPALSSSPLVRPPEIIAEAGILPTSLFSVFDRLSEAFDRNVFSFGIPQLRAQVALTQAAERIAELQALERAGQLTPASTRGLLRAHQQLLAIADRIVAGQLARGIASPDLLFLLVRTRLAAAEVLEELEEERVAERELDEAEFPSSPGAFPEASPRAPVGDEVEDFAELLDEKIEELVEFEDGVLPSGNVLVSEAVLRLLAEQKIAKAERDLLRAIRTTEERLAQGKILIAETELRAAADAALVTARQLFAAGNYREALRLAKDARRIADRLKSGQIAVQPNALRSPDAEERVTRILQQLVEHGFLDAEAQGTALLRARQAIEKVRQSPLAPPASPEADRDDLDEDDEEDADDDKDDSSNSGSGSSGGGSGSSGSGSSGSGR